MSPHDPIRELLGLSAAGLLDAEGERRVREHLRECPECAAMAEEFAALASAAASLPVPDMPLGLAARTTLRVQAQLAADADRRQAAILAATAGLLSWAMMLVTWYGSRVLTGSTAATALLWWIAPLWIAVPATAGLLRSRRSERRIS